MARRLLAALCPPAIHTAHALLLHAAATVAACTDDASCSLLGTCVAGACVCDAGWEGPACGALTLGPSRVVWPSASDGGVSASWGASMLAADPNATAAESDHVHMFVNTVCRRASCAHTQSAQIVHAVSSTGPRGPFAFREVAVPAEIENIHAARDPTDGTVLLYYGDHEFKYPNATCTGGAPSGPATAGGSEAAADAEKLPLPRSNPYPRGVKRMGIAHASSVDGPWSLFFPSYDASLKPYLPIVNPSPLVLANGTVLLAFRFDKSGVGETNALAAADSWRGPYRLVSAAATPVREPTEDPFLFRNKRGIHMLFHCYRGGRNPPNATGCHTFSSDDGRTWTVSPDPAYTTTLRFDNGTVADYDFRERPEILFDAAGAPKFLLTGAERGLKSNDFPNCDSWSFVTDVA